MTHSDLEDRIERTHAEERRVLEALGRSVLAGLPGHEHRRRLAEVRLDLEALHAADRLQRRGLRRELVGALSFDLDF